MFKVVFYTDESGYSALENEMIELASKAESNKSARIAHNQISLYIYLLKNKGFQLPTTVSKYIGNGIWELRPSNKRVLYYFHKDETFVLLHMFVKKTQKTPRSEIEKAEKERDDYINRNGGKQ